MDAPRRPPVISRSSDRIAFGKMTHMNRWSHDIGVFLSKGSVLIAPYGYARGFSHLRAGSLPKKATNVMKEMKSTMSAIAVMVSIVSKGPRSPLPLYVQRGDGVDTE